VLAFELRFPAYCSSRGGVERGTGSQNGNGLAASFARRSAGFYRDRARTPGHGLQHWLALPCGPGTGRRLGSRGFLATLPRTSGHSVHVAPDALAAADGGDRKSVV